MSDDKSKVGGQDRSRVSAEEPYEVEYFAHRHGISQQEAREIIQKHGPRRINALRDDPFDTVSLRCFEKARSFADH